MYGGENVLLGYILQNFLDDDFLLDSLVALRVEILFEVIIYLIWVCSDVF